MICSHIYSKEPFLATISNGIPTSLINNILTDSNFQPSPVFAYNSQNENTTMNEVRNSSTMHTGSKYIKLTKIVLEYLKNEFNHSYDLTCCESWQIARYEPGQYYRPHHDYFNIKNHKDYVKNDRVATVILYLTDDFKGGQTFFKILNIKISPMQGAMVYFTYPADTPSSIKTLHEGCDVISGIKYIATLWIRQRSFP
jgi:prolyl 4-hydroxylase